MSSRRRDFPMSRGITIMPANDLVDMHDDPATVLRRKPDFVHGGSVQSCSRPARAMRSFPRATPAHCSPAQHCTAAASRASAEVRWHQLCRARTVRSCCAMRVQTPNAPQRCCSSLRSSLRCTRRDQRRRQTRVSVLSTTAMEGYQRVIRSARRAYALLKRRATKAV